MTMHNPMPAYDGRFEFDLADRMRRALRVSGVSVHEMADYLEVTRGTVSTWINGRVSPSAQTLMLFAMRTGMPYAWLKTGTAPSEDEAVDVRPEGFEPPTFCSVVDIADWRLATDVEVTA
ncbi:MAG: helix-turn-helix transcriptional regulator [Leifsonia sp.]